MTSNKAFVLALMLAHVNMADGAILKTIQRRSLVASGVPDPHCQTGVISLSGKPKSCCAGYCGACDDYETCKSVNGQNSENACCASKIYKMRCGNAPANVCLKTCSEAVPPCIMDKDVDAMPVKLGATTYKGVPPCNEVVPFTRQSHATAITKGKFMVDLHVANSDLQQAFDMVQSAKAELVKDAMVRSYLADLPKHISEEYDATVKLADEVLAEAPKSQTDVQDLSKKVTANKVGAEIPNELELKKDDEMGNAVEFLREAEEVKKASQGLQEQALDHAAAQAKAKEAAAHQAEKEELHEKLRQLLKKRSQVKTGVDTTMGLLAVAVECNQSKKHDAQANSTEKLDASMEIATIVKNKLLDIAAMTLGMKDQSKKNVAVLKKDVEDMKPLVKTAKKLFKSQRKNIRDDYKACKKEIKHDKNHWRTTWQCKPFVSYFSSFLEVQTQGRRRRGKKAAKKAKKAKKKSVRKAKKAARCSEKPTCELRQAKRRAKQAAKDDYEKVRKQDKEDKKQLRGAVFQQDILPKVILLVAPNLATALKQFHVIGDDIKDIVKACKQKEGSLKACIPIAEMDLVKLLKNYMNLQLNAVLSKDLTAMFTKIEDTIWKIFDPLMSAVKNSIIGAVGSIPFVGGVLATAVDVLFTVLYGVVKKAVGNALDEVESLLQGDIVTAIDKAVFKVGLFTDEKLKDKVENAKLASSMEDSGNAAQQEPVSKTNKQITDQAAAAKTTGETKAKGAASSITASGNGVSQAQSEDDQEDTTMIQSEDSDDIKSDE